MEIMVEKMDVGKNSSCPHAHAHKWDIAIAQKLLL